MHINSVLVSLTKGEHVPPGVLADFDVGVFWDVAARHGLLELLATRLSEMDGAPPALRGSARTLMHKAAARDLISEMATRQLLERFDRAQINALLMKGALLAYTHYSRPDLRPRADTDVLIEQGRRDAAHEVLLELGYESQVSASSDLVLHQRTYLRLLSSGHVHLVDLHWRLTNPEVFGGLLTFQEMAVDAVRIPRLGRGLSAVHSLLLACVHRVAHHAADDRLIWLYDIHLLAAGLSSSEWRRFVELAVTRRVAAVCRASLEQCIAQFGTAVPPGLWEQPSAGNSQHHEASADYLVRNRSHLQAVIGDLRALTTWRSRWRLVCDYAFPPVEYMRNVYAPASAMPLPWLYMRRIWFGARKWVASS